MRRFWFTVLIGAALFVPLIVAVAIFASSWTLEVAALYIVAVFIVAAVRARARAEV